MEPVNGGYGIDLAYWVLEYGLDGTIRIWGGVLM